MSIPNPAILEGMVRMRPLVLVLLAAALTGCFGDEDEPQSRSKPTAPAPPPAGAHVSADLGAAPRRGPSMSGFLHSLEGDTPADAAIRPLQPRFWRSVPQRAPYERVRSLGASYQLVLSDLWGYPSAGWEGRGPPWEHLDAWARTVRRAARSLRGRPAEFDVWNEPDAENFWNGTREQFFRVYAVAARTLVDELGPAAVVGGPSTRAPIPAWVGGLLRHCRAHGCRVSFISYHANLLPTQPIPEVSVQLRKLRKLVDRYRDLGLSRIVVNESVGPVDQYSPGSIVGYLAQLEAGGADAAARSCWPGLQGEDNCTNGTLEGLLTPTGRPRSAWWAYRAYGEGAESRVPSRSDSWTVASLASVRPGVAEVVLGRLDRAASGTAAIDVELQLHGLRRALPGARSALLTVERLPNSGDQPLVEPQRVLSRRVSLRELAKFRPGALGPNEAMVVRVQSPAA
jgi:xylan 1,4-beta-xylosidase